LIRIKPHALTWLRDSPTLPLIIKFGRVEGDMAQTKMVQTKSSERPSRLIRILEILRISLVPQAF
jgi:hypothetical protein